MALTKEDGTGSNPNANSYSDAETLRNYAVARGVDLSALSDADCEVLLVKAMDYIEGKRSRFQGTKSNTDQPLQWPRQDVWVDNLLVGSDAIPRELEYAQLALAIESRDKDLQPNRLPSDKGAVIRERVEGAVEVEYDKQNRASFVPAFAKADSLLRPLYKNSGMFLVRS